MTKLIVDRRSLVSATKSECASLVGRWIDGPIDFEWYRINVQWTYC